MSKLNREQNLVHLTFDDGTEVFLGVTVGISGAPGEQVPFPAWFVGRKTSSGTIAAIMGQRISMLTGEVVAKMRQEGDTSAQITQVVDAAKAYVPVLQPAAAKFYRGRFPYSRLVQRFEEDLAGLQTAGAQLN